MENITNGIRLSDGALTLRRLRTENGYSYEKLSELSGISVIDLFYFEQDKSSPSKKQLAALAQLYGVEKAYFDRIFGNKI